MGFVLLFVGLAAVGAVVLVARHRNKQLLLRHREAALVPVRQLAFEDITAFGEDLTKLDAEISGRSLDAGSTADYHRALDAYEAAKRAGDSMKEPDDARHLAGIIEDGRYAIGCVRARVSGEPLPTRRRPCFFDPRHGPSVADVPYSPSGGAERQVPACALDVERVRAGADPDIRKVSVGASRVPYWQGGRAYDPYLMGYFGADALTWLFLGSLAFDGYGGGYGDGGYESSDAGGDGSGDGGGAEASTFDGGGDFGF